MKKLYFGLVALAALSLSSCQKEQDVKAPEKKMVTVTLVADKAGDETKAAAVEEDSKVTYEWTEADKNNLKLYGVTIGSDNKEILTKVEDPTINVSSDNKVLTITATVEENTTLRAVVAGEMTGGDTPKPKIKVNQIPAVDNFDSNTDILVADDVTVSEANELALTFRRQVVVAKMTLKNLVEGEKVNKVIISSASHLTGFYEYADAKMSGQNKEITLAYEDVPVGSSKEFPVYFVVMPNEGHTLTVTVKTDQYTYTKEFGNNAINFNLGGFARFGVNMSGCGEPVVDVDYSGEWVIAGTHSGHDLAATAWSSGYVYPASEVTLDAENEVVTVQGTTAPYKMTITRIESGDYAEMYTIVDANGNYLSATGGTSNNNLQGKTTPDQTSYWSIEKNTDGSYNIIASKVAGDGVRNEMRVNYNSGNPRFTCYTASSGQPKVVLYPFSKIEGETPVVYEFKKVSSVTSGKKYLIVGCKNNEYHVANPVPSNKNYAYLASTVVTPSGDVISLEAMTNAFTIAASGDGYSIKQSDDRYLYASGNYNTINAGTNPSSVWTITAQSNGTFNIASEGTYIQYGQGTYTTFGRYAELQDGAVLPFLYEYQGEEPEVPVLTAIAITTAPTTTTFTVGDTFVFDGKVTASYSDGSTKDVTANVSTDGATVISSAGENKTVTVTYTENEVTATATYTVTVNNKDENEKTVTLTNANIVAAGDAATSYDSWDLEDEEGNEWSAYAIKNKHSNATSAYHFLQIKKSDSSTQYFIHIPEIGTKITKIVMTVSSYSKPMDGGSNTASLFFSSNNTTSATGEGVASGTGAGSVTINTSDLNLNTGYITASGAVRIWDVAVTYE